MEKAYGIIILAAGNSSRLGEPKQLLKYRNKTLIRNVVDSAVEIKNSIVVVVTGSNNELIENELQNIPIHLAHNNNWPEGMASSIKVGIEALLHLNDNVQGAILAVSDQPFVTANLFDDMLQEAEMSGSEIVASEYDGTCGTPVFFTKKYFDALKNLSGQEGAKKLLKGFDKDVTTVPFSLGDIDIDTKEDFQKLLNIQ